MYIEKTFPLAWDLSTFVEPAFYDHEQPYGGNATKKSENSPCQSRKIKTMKHDHGGSKGGKSGKSSNVTDISYYTSAIKCSYHRTDKIRG